MVSYEKIVNKLITVVFTESKPRDGAIKAHVDGLP